MSHELTREEGPNLRSVDGGATRATDRARICFLLGVMRRSGTNFLFNLLKLHPGITGPGPIWEDYVLWRADLLDNCAR